MGQGHLEMQRWGTVCRLSNSHVWRFHKICAAELGATARVRTEDAVRMGRSWFQCCATHQTLAYAVACVVLQNSADTDGPTARGTSTSGSKAWVRRVRHSSMCAQVKRKGIISRGKKLRKIEKVTVAMQNGAKQVLTDGDDIAKALANQFYKKWGGANLTTREAIADYFAKTDGVPMDLTPWDVRLGLDQVKHWGRHDTDSVCGSVEHYVNCIYHRISYMDMPMPS
jgi:hypothetical protein